jgi:formylglycine-generating enzyme required for sulfatase activity
VSNTAISSAPASLALLGIASAADPAFPAGTVVPGFGLAFPSSLDDVLIRLGSPDPLFAFGRDSKASETAAAPGYSAALPTGQAGLGRTLCAPGLLLDPGTSPSLALTNDFAAQTTTSSPTTVVPCSSQLPGMSIIKQGSFQMGSDEASGPPFFSSVLEKPVHSVTLSYCFWMGRNEVTQAEYEALMGTNPSLFVGANRPVEQVTWHEAQAYCAKLTAQQSLLGNVPAGYQYRLPTEAEWEYACRAGTATEFNLGNALFCDQARFSFSWHSNSDCRLGNHVSVGRYRANAWGLHDMHGNVQEWCLDSFEIYPAHAVTDPFVTGSPFRIVRGGAWNGSSYHCRSAIRPSYAPDFAESVVGFRVVLAPILVP